MAFPRQRLHEGVEFCLVGVVRHPHKALLESRRSLLKNGVEARLQTSRDHSGRGDPRFVGRQDRRTERAEARTDDTNLLSVDLWTLVQPIHTNWPGIHPVLHRDIDAEHRALILAGAIY